VFWFYSFCEIAAGSGGDRDLPCRDSAADRNRPPSIRHTQLMIEGNWEIGAAA
jgi:hypothetical protein